MSSIWAPKWRTTKIWSVLYRNVKPHGRVVATLSKHKVDTPQGKKAIELSRPSSIEELAALNSIMRLASEKGEQPLEKFKRFKENPQAWEQEMIDNGLSKQERELLHHYLDYSYGVAGAQEDLMNLTRDPAIAGWSMGESDALRKGVAKKDEKLFNKLQDEFFKNMKEKNLSKALCEYVWNFCVKPQASYSFK